MQRHATRFVTFATSGITARPYRMLEDFFNWKGKQNTLNKYILQDTL